MADEGFEGNDSTINAVTVNMEQGADELFIPDDDSLSFENGNVDVLKLDDDSDSVSDGEESGFDEESVAANEPPTAQDVSQLCPDGVLTEDALETGLSQLGRSAEGTLQVFLQLTLPGFGLKDVNILGDFCHLQKVEMPYNELTDVSVLGNMPYLLELDVCHNQLTKLLDFKPPKNLNIVNFSYNKLESIPDLSAHHALHTLTLDYNNISEITGLEKCQSLKTLNMRHNRVETIDGLDNLPIQNLNLSCNKLKRIENIDTLQYLRVVNFSGNKIRSLTGLQNHDFLESIDMEDNEIIDLSEVQFIKSLKLLQSLNLQRNPLRELPEYRLAILFHIPQLLSLDNRRADIKEKVAATNLFEPSMEVVAARDHIMHVVYSFLQPSRVLDSTLPSMETPYPMLVLVGPQGAGKKDLALKLAEEFPDYFGYGVPHTTRQPRASEEQGHDYNFVSIEEFEATIKMGKFLQTYSLQGELYGVTMDAIEAVAREGLACVTQMELEGVLTLKNTHFEPRFVLLLPLNWEAHDKRLRERDEYSEPQITRTLARTEVYSEYHQQHPGFFDMVINSDNIIEAYKQLRQLVLDYLGIRGGTPSISELDQNNTDLTLDKEATTDTMNNGGNAVHISRTWSKHSVSESATQRTAKSPKSARGIVETESVKRRRSAAKEAVVAPHSSSHQKTLLSGPRTVPVARYTDEVNGEKKRAFSAPTHNMDALPPISPDSSQSSGGQDSSLSNISEARDMDEEEPGSPAHSHHSPAEETQKNADLPTETVDRLELMSGSMSKSRSTVSGLMAPRPASRESDKMSGSRSRPTSGRPGSDRHPVLPPIGQSQEV